MPPYNIQKRDSLKLQNIPDMEGDLRNNLSRQELIRHPDDGSDPNVVVVPRRDSSEDGERPPENPRLTRKQKTTVAILCFVNLINYMDRFTVAGILTDITNTFHMTESQSGLLQTAFVLVYMIMAPVFGYLGDRFSRKYLMAVGIFFWCLATLVGSFMPNYLLFLLFRCFVGVGEASYSTIAPTIISDLFVKDLRSKMLAVFYFAIPVGSGLGYIIGAEVTNLLLDSHGSEAWRWGLRVTPVMGFLALFLILCCLEEPPRGESEGGQHLQSTSFLEDLGYLFTNKSFILSTLAFTCVTFVAGALAWWGPFFTELGVRIQDHPNAKENDVAFVFGAIAMTAGLIGVPLGSFTGQKLRIKFPFADPLVCGVGLLISVPLIIGAMVLAEFNTVVSYVVVFFGQVFLNLNWAVVSDIVLYIVIPTRRSSAEAFQILFSHALGDAGSPYLIGVVAESLQPYITPRNTTTNTTMEPPSTTTLDYFNSTEATITTTAAPEVDDYVKFKALQYSMFLCAVINILGAIFFFLNSCFIRKDKEKCDQIIADNSEPKSQKTDSNGQLVASVSVIQSTTLVVESQKC
ncbi:protein spinster isoform X1 [Penaeus vannamei]|uniref:protein spinster isoform X1 n=1 Tax=Penaeus vannamei TaxID=6689 RepID=UPI00387F41D4